MRKWLNYTGLHQSRVKQVIVVLISVAVACYSADAQKEKPNVLFLMSDEHSGQVVGASGNKIVKTPAIDALAAKGYLFRHAYVQNPICVPSRTSLATGIMPSKLGVYGNGAHKQDVLRDTPLSIARVFSSAGYNVEWLGKEHWGTDNEGLGFGDDNVEILKSVSRVTKDYKSFQASVGRLPESARLIPPNITEIGDGVLTDHAIKWLEEYNDTKPFFFGLSLHDPHFPFTVQPKYWRRYRDTIDLPTVTPGMIEDLPEYNQERRQFYGFGDLKKWQIKKARAIYYGKISYMDEQVGRMTRKIDDLGLQGNTIIVYISDHGEQAGHHGLWYKNSFYEDSVKVPMIISYPKALDSNRKYFWPVNAMDTVPTLYDLCGIQIPKGLDGKTLLPLIRGQENGKRRYAISETNTNRGGRMIRLRRWKYCWFRDGKEQLFDLWNDPTEEFNLINNTKYSRLIRNLNLKALEGYIPKTS